MIVVVIGATPRLPFVYTQLRTDQTSVLSHLTSLSLAWDVLLGCGPVGICAITAALEWVSPGNLYAIDSFVHLSLLLSLSLLCVFLRSLPRPGTSPAERLFFLSLCMVSFLLSADSVPERLLQASHLGAISIPLAASGPESALEIIKKRTDGRGCDAVLEIVGCAFVCLPPCRSLNRLGKDQD
jgi:hypothetical protein